MAFELKVTKTLIYILLYRSVYVHDMRGNMNMLLSKASTCLLNIKLLFLYHSRLYLFYK